MTAALRDVTRASALVLPVFTLIVWGVNALIGALQ